MACGTGKTFTALRIAEDVVPENGSISIHGAFHCIGVPSKGRMADARHESHGHRCNLLGFNCRAKHF